MTCFCAPVLSMDCELCCISLLRDPDLLFSVPGLWLVNRKQRSSSTISALAVTPTTERIYIMHWNDSYRYTVSADICGTAGVEYRRMTWYMTSGGSCHKFRCKTCICIFSEGSPEQTEPLSSDMFGPHSIYSIAGPLHCANMFHLIESDAKSIIVYSKVTLVNLDMKTIAWNTSRWNYSASGCPFCPCSDNIMKNETVTIFWHSSVWL